MGLHLNYELRLPASTRADDVTDVLSRLHELALTLPFKAVSPMYHEPFATGGSPDPRLDAFRLWASVIAHPNDEYEVPLTGDLDTAQGFIIHPGDRCELATVGFMLRGDASGRQHEWFWHCCCKTQYASVISDTHLVNCHTALVRLLDDAGTLGVAVVVRDETHYWETRDDGRLIAEARVMNQVVAAMAGKLGDAIGPGVGAPIFEHPDFERLEMGDPT